MKKINSTNEFIKQSEKIHNNKYNYSKTNYINSKIKVCIICPEHGDFWITPNNHLNKRGCSKCSKRFNYSTEEFIQKARSVHSDRYNYDKVKYINTETKIKITCFQHGDFDQVPNNHLQGAGCPVCFGNKKLNTNEFIKKANNIHNNKYDYSKIQYTNSRTKVTIICPLHGEFNQTPSSHLSETGCPACKASKGELAIKDILNKHNIKYESQYKLPEIISNYEIDFYLPDYNLLIEFHGIQHFEYVSFFHDGNYTLSDQKRRDEMVRDAAIRWKYNYLELNYKQFKHLSKDQFEDMVINKIRHFLINNKESYHDCK